MEPTKSPNEIYELFDALFSNEISEEGHGQLQHLLENDPQARKAYYDYIDILQGLGNLSQEVHDITFFDKVTDKILGQTTSIPEIPKKRTTQFYLKYFAIIIASAVLVLGIEWGAVGRTPWNHPISKEYVEVPQQPPTLVATLVRARDCQWAGEQQPKFEVQHVLS